MNRLLIKIYLGLLWAAILFHFCILIQIIPYHIAWGGRLQNDTEMYFFESCSILVNAFLSWILLMKGRFLKYRLPGRVINMILWIFFVVFTLNTIGNLFAKTDFEKVFAAITGLLALLTWKVIMQK